MHTVASPVLWAAFITFVLVMLALDLGVFHRKAHVVSFREALSSSIVWVGLAACFGAWVYMSFGPDAGIEFATSYLIEKALSVDNIFVFVVIFSALRIPGASQHRVLFWGILSALVLRAGMIFGGTALLERFHWLIYVFGGFLVFTGAKLLFAGDRASNPESSPALRLVRKLIPNTSDLHGNHFFVRLDARWVATPLFMALVLVELTDVVFALDSIPAIFAITRDPFIVFTSNIFAILGLRSLFFVLAQAIDKFAYLKVGLAFVLVFVGLKMSLVDVYKLPAVASLCVVFAMLAIAVIASLLKGEKNVAAPSGESATKTS